MSSESSDAQRPKIRTSKLIRTQLASQAMDTQCDELYVYCILKKKKGFILSHEAFVLQNIANFTFLQKVNDPSLRLGFSRDNVDRQPPHTRRSIDKRTFPSSVDHTFSAEV